MNSINPLTISFITRYTDKATTLKINMYINKTSEFIISSTKCYNKQYCACL